MKVEIHRGKLLIMPETNFEINWIYSRFELGKPYKAWLKTGLSASDLLGITIEPAPTDPQKEIKNGII